MMILMAKQEGLRATKENTRHEKKKNEKKRHRSRRKNVLGAHEDTKKTKNQ
jgi:hypothetical protein